MLSFDRRLFDILGDGGDGGGGSAGDAGAPGADNKPGGASGDNPPPGGKTFDWTEIKQALPEDLRADSSLSTINSLEGLVKGYVHSQKAMGNKVSIPDKHATEEDWQQFARKLGVPEKAEEYDFKRPEGVDVEEEFVKGLREVGHKAGILPHQMEKVFGQYVDWVNKFSETQEATIQAQHEKDVNELKAEWGEAFEDRKKAANVAFKELLPDEGLRERLINDGLASHPAVVRILANAAKLFNEDTFVGHGEGKLGGLTPKEALEKAQQIQGDDSHPYRIPGHPNHKAAQEEVANLYKIAYPG